MKISDPPKFLTAAQYAAERQISLRTVTRLIAAGKIKVQRFGKSLRISNAENEAQERSKPSKPHGD